MNIWEKMKACELELTPKELEVYRLLPEHTTLFCTSTASNLATRFGIAQSTLSRFCQKVGYEGFSDFRLDLAIASATQGIDRTSSAEPHDFGRNFIDLVNDVLKAVPENQLNFLAQRIALAPNIYVTGTSSSNVPAHLLSLRLLLFSLHSHLIEPGFDIETMRIIRPTDVVVLFSAENPTHRDFLSFVSEMSAKNRPYIVLISNTQHHPLRRKVNEVIVLPRSSQDRYLNRLDISISQMVFAYMLLSQVGQIIAQRNGT